MRRWRAFLVVLGGIIVHVSLGTLYTLGNMAPYITSYIRLRSEPPDMDYSHVVWINALCSLGLSCTMFVGGFIENRIGPRWATLLGGFIMSGGVMLSSVTIKESLSLFMISYGAMFGIGVALAYAVPMACAMRWLPEHKGLANGLVVAGFGGGAFIFDQVQTALINPDNLPANVTHAGQKYFNQAELLDRVPMNFVVLGATYAAMQLLGSLLLANPPSPASEYAKARTSDDGPRDVTPLKMLKTGSFYMIWATFLLNGFPIIFISSLYKAYGQTFIEDDTFLARAGAAAAVFNAAGRIAWGRAVDHSSYRATMLANCALMAFWMGTFPLPAYLADQGFQAVARGLFFTWVCLIYATFSGIFALMPTATARCFGHKYVAVNYGLVFTSQAITGVMAAFFIGAIQEYLGWNGVFLVSAGFSFLGLLLTVAFRAKRHTGDNV